MEQQAIERNYLGLELKDLAGYGAMLAAVIALSGLLFSRNFAIIAALLLLHAATSFVFRELKKARIGLELVMLITMLSAFAYGGKAAALIGAGAMLMDYVFSLRFSYFVIVTTTAYALIGLAASFFSGYSITTIGIIAVVLYNAFTSAIIVGLLGGHLDKCVRFWLTNLAINAVLFTTAAPFLLSVMRG